MTTLRKKGNLRELYGLIVVGDTIIFGPENVWYVLEKQILGERTQAIRIEHREIPDWLRHIATSSSVWFSTSSVPFTLKLTGEREVPDEVYG